MEPLLPSEVARLVYGYLKKEKNEDAAECFLKSSPHLTECFQMFKANRNFNIKVSGFNLHDIFDNFGTMCTMIEKRIPETCESKTLIEKLQFLLDKNHISTKKDELVEKKLNMVDKCVGNTVNTKDQSTHTTTNIEANKSISEELLEVPSFTEIISNNISKIKESDSFNDETSITDEKNSVTFSSSCLSSMTQLENNTGTMTISKFDEKESSKIFQMNKQICSTPAKKNEQTKINSDVIPQFSPKNIHSLNSSDQAESQQIPEATSLDSMPGFSKEDRIKDGSIVIDTGELVDTFLNDQSLLEKIADTINKSFDSQKETDNILESKVLDPPTLEKALDSTQSDPQIKNILDEFLVFNVDNADSDKNTCSNGQLDDSIKSRLRSARKKDDVPSKSKKNNFNISKNIVYGNEECLKVDNNIVLIHEGNIKTTVFENYDLLSNQLVLQSSDPYNFDSTKVQPGEDYFAKSDYVKIAPKITPMLKNYQASEKHIFPKRRRQLLEVPGIRSKFRRTNITRQQSDQTPKSIVIEVPNQNSFEIQEKNHIDGNDIVKLPEVSSKVNNVVVHDTPDDRLKPPKNKSMSTPRRRSTHIRCLDFSTPQPKNMTRNQARSKLFCDSPKRLEKCLEEPSSSPLPKLQADWGSVNGFESMIKKEIIKHWDTDIREMVGAGILTSDADGRKTRKKKTPRKKIKSVNDQNNSVLLKDKKKSSNISIKTNELHTDVSNISEITYDGLNEQDSNTPLLDVQKPLLEKQTKCPLSSETLNNVTELYNKQPQIKSNSLNTSLKSLKKESEFSMSLETPDKMTELYNEQPPTISDSIKNINDKKSIIKQNEFLISLETPDKTTELYTKQASVKSDSLINDNKERLFNKQSEFTNSLETPDKVTELNNKQLSIKSDSSKSEYATQIKVEQCHVNELKNNQNRLVKSSILNTMPEITNQEKDSNFLKRFNNHNYSPIENKSNEPIKPLKEQGFVQTNTNNSSDLNSPLKCISIESVKPNLIETPYKCDDAAVDVPETPISKIIREYDPSKMVTPLPCTPEHDDSLTETPLTKVFRETSYLNRPPISPFPPTPGNSMSVDTLIVPPEQDHFKTSNNTNCKINGLKECLTQPIQTTTTNSELSTKSKKDKVKCTSLKSKLNDSSKSKVKNGSKLKNVEAKIKQVYESVKIELFGSDISTSPNKHELSKTNEQHKSIVINKKPKEEEKKSGFKPIPKRKSIESMSVVNVNGVESNLSDELNMKSTNTPFIKPIIVQCENNTSGKVKKTIKKSMVHFDDPVEKFFRLSKSPTLDKSNNKKIDKIENKTTVNDNSEQLIGLSRYLNKTSPKVYDCSPKEKKIKMIEPTVKMSKLNNTDSDTNYSEIYDVGKSSKNISTSDISSETKTNEMNNKKIKLSENCIINTNKVSNETENVKHTMSVDDTPNCISKNKMNTSLDRSESPIVVNTSVNNNTSCLTITHDDKLDAQVNKVCDSLSNMKYLKKQKVYEVITDDGEHMMVKLNVSEIFTLLDIASELDLIASPSKTTNKVLDVTPKLENCELENDEEILMPVTSTPKDIVEIKIEKDDRGRRSPSFWDDSVHNYPIKHRDDRYRDTNHWQNKIHNKYDYKPYDYKHRSSKFRCHDERFDSPIHHSQRSHHQNVKREFREDSVKDIHRYKYKNDKRRSYHDHYSKGRKRQEENERFSIPQRMSQNELQKLNRSEDIVKKVTKRPPDRAVYNKTPAKVSKIEHQRLLKNVDVDDFLSVVHGQK